MLRRKLHLGIFNLDKVEMFTSIAPPLLTSGVIPFVTVMCSPSRACNLAGDTLTITEGAQQVTVEWHAPADDGWRAWNAARTFNAPSAR